jgi:hypothetical protein
MEKKPDLSGVRKIQTYSALHLWDKHVAQLRAAAQVPDAPPLMQPAFQAAIPKDI